MIFRNLGSGPQFARYPQAPPAFIIQTNDSLVLIGCPPQLPQHLERYGLNMKDISMILPLDSSIPQIGGLDEVGAFFQGKKDRPYLSCPADLLSRILGRLEYPTGFDCKAIMKVSFKEEHVSETFTFVPNYRESTSFGFQLEESKIFVTGRAPVNEDWLYRHFDNEVILHYDTPELVDLPVYLQDKIWLYGYEGKNSQGCDPLPMLYLPQGIIIYDSDRKGKIINKARHLREASKKILGRDVK